MTDPVARASLLPRNETPFEQASSETSAKLLDAQTELVRTPRRAATAPVSLLPWLAWERSVDVWDPAWTEDHKRQVIAQSFDYHRTKGTRYALDLAMDALGLGLTVSEWFEYGGAPYCFKIAVTVPLDQQWTADQARLVYRTAIRAKNTRSYLDTISLTRAPIKGAVGVGATVRSSARLRGFIQPTTAMVFRPAVFAGGTCSSRVRIRHVFGSVTAINLPTSRVFSGGAQQMHQRTRVGA